MKKTMLIVVALILLLGLLSGEEIDYRNLEWDALMELGIGGDAEAQLLIGVSYYIDSDYAEALKWYRKAADQGVAEAQYMVGHMYDIGEGVTQDYKEAVKWYHMAADQGNADAQFNIGIMYDFDEGFTEDYKEALKWYRKAADQGNAEAIYKIGLTYHYGYGVPQNYTEACRWYKAGAELGHLHSQFDLGHMYEIGSGVILSLDQAYFWYLIAAANSNEVFFDIASQNRDRIADELSKDQRLKIEQQARDWMIGHGFE